VNAKEVALYAQDAGVKALFIHGRTGTQEYSGLVDYRIIREVKRNIQIPVIASGDILSAPLARKMFEDTGCDGIAVARGALGNPWIFHELDAFLKNTVIIKKPGRDEVIKVMIEHLNENVAFYRERVGVVKFRKFIAWYTKGWRKVRQLREKSSRVKTQKETEELIKLLC
jgi:tRNA-dihydrouridine synthase